MTTLLPLSAVDDTIISPKPIKVSFPRQGVSTLPTLEQLPIAALCGILVIFAARQP